MQLLKKSTYIVFRLSNIAIPTVHVLQEMLCNAIMCELIERKGVTKDVVRMSHPGGAIGARLSTSS